MSSRIDKKANKKSDLAGLAAKIKQKAEKEKAEKEKAQKQKVEKQKVEEIKKSKDKDTAEAAKSASEDENDDEVKLSEESNGGKAKITSFHEFDLVPELLESIQSLKFNHPTPIQAEAIPHALKGNDIIGLAQTGSGKTAAFAIPILQALAQNPAPFFACILAPTRELAHQIAETFKALGSNMGLRCSILIGGMDLITQARELAKKPHVIVATPGRLIEHLEETKGFSLRFLKYLVMDEADRLLDLDFGPALDKLLAIIPKERTTYLFSATMTSKIEKLQRASLSNPVRVAVSDKYSTVETLVQSIMFISATRKDTLLVHLLSELTGKSIIVFTRTCAHAQRTALLGKSLGFSIIPLHGSLSQAQRLGALNKFKAGHSKVLVATDVAARGLDISSVDIVINYDLPTDSKAYIHRVGRTARAGRSGKSISIVTQYDLELLLRIESAINMKLKKDLFDANAIESLQPHVDRAMSAVISQMKEMNENNAKNGRGRVNGRRNRKES